MSDVEAIRREFVQLWGAMAHNWGVSPTAAKVYSWLLSREGTAEADEIMEGLELSRGAVSMACKELRDWGLIFPEKQPGSRRSSYRPATDLEKVVRSIIQNRKRREWDPVVERLDEWIPQLADDPSSDATIFRERLESLAAMANLADSMMEVFLRGGLVSRIGLKLLANAADASAGRTGETSPDETLETVEAGKETP